MKNAVFVSRPISGPKEDKHDSPKFLKIENYLSEFFYDWLKIQARKNLGIDKVLEELKEELEEKIGELKDDTYIKLELEGENAVDLIAYTNSDYPDIESLRDALDLILYTDLTCTLSGSPSVKETGESVPQIEYNWSYNKSTIVELYFNSVQIDNDLRSYTVEGEFTSNTTGQLTASDGTKTINVSTTLNFYPGIYYGVSSKEELTSEDIIDFTRLLRSSRSTTITVNGTDDSSNHIWICIPYSYGAATFTVGGFEGGFELIDDSFSFTRYEGTTILYRLYRSDNGGLGSTTIVIS